MTTSVLLTSDQSRGRLPDHCVLTGEPTSTAVKQWAVEARYADLLCTIFGSGIVLAFRVLRRGIFEVSLPVTERRWNIWRRRAGLAGSMTAAGLAGVVAGTISGNQGLATVGFVGVVLAIAWRAHAHRTWWLSVRYDPALGHLFVARTHEAFDRDARRLFERSL